MSAPSPSSQPLRTGDHLHPVPFPDALDASCRVPLFVLWVGAAIWLVVFSIFAVIASIKFHGPNFLADSAWLTYGRVYPAAMNALLYGFAVPAGLGVSLWLFARSGQVRLAQPWLVAVGAKLWNLGVLLGIIGILAGGSTGFERLEMPRYASVILFLGYLLMGVWAMLTFHFRRERSLHPSQWFLFTSVFWFAWIYLTASILLVAFPVRGVAQQAINLWYSNNLSVVWFGLAGLGTAFYFLPRLLGRPLHSDYLVLFVFWTLILFGSWGGILQRAPLPAWMPAISTAAAVLTLIPMLAVALTMFHMMRGHWPGWKGDVSLLFIVFGIGSLLLASVMNAMGALREVSWYTEFTWFVAAQSYLSSYGFFAMVMFGAIYYAVPRVTGVPWPAPKLVRVHFWLAAIGIILLAVPLAVGGLVQGARMSGSTLAYMDVIKATLPYLRVSTIGDMLILAGHLLLLGNITALSVRYYREHFLPAYAAATAEIAPAEVKL